MKSAKLLLFLFSISVIVLYGCSGDGPTDNTKPTLKTPTAKTFNTLRDSARSSRMQTTQFKAEDGLSFTSDKGVSLDIPANCISKNGNAVTGSVELEYMELFNKSDMLVTNRPTMGITANGDKKVLISGGEFSINAYQNGEKLTLSCSGTKLHVPAGITGGLDNKMKKWVGTVDSADNLTWEKTSNGANSNSSVIRKDSAGAPNNKYTVLMNNFGWVNCDYFYDDPRPKTNLKVAPPQGYDPNNSAMYLSFDGETNSLMHLSFFENGFFVKDNQRIPVGLEMHVIFVTEENGQWRYAIKGVTVAENDQYSFTLSETTAGSEQNLTDAIDALP